jgi:hypothetical protein
VLNSAPNTPVFISQNDVKVDGEGKFVAVVNAPRTEPKEGHYTVDVVAATTAGGAQSEVPFLVHG